MSNEGKTVKIHYVGTLEDGEQFDSSRDHGQPLEFVCMSGQVIPGFDDAVVNMEPGETKTVTIAPADGYGEHDPEKIVKIQFDMLPGADRLEIGQHIRLASANGIPMPCTVVDKDDSSVTMDMNHPLAGKDLTFEIELLEVS